MGAEVAAGWPNNPPVAAGLPKSPPADCCDCGAPNAPKVLAGVEPNALAVVCCVLFGVPKAPPPNPVEAAGVDPKPPVLAAGVAPKLNPPGLGAALLLPKRFDELAAGVVPNPPAADAPKPVAAG